MRIRPKYFAAGLSGLLLGANFSLAESALPNKAQEKKIQTRVEAFLRQMTLEEKAGEMTQVTLDVVSKKVAAGQINELDPVALDDVILHHHVGSILNVGSSSEYNNSAFSIEHWREVITRIQDVAKKSRLGIPVLYGIDSIHGAQYTRGATIFPQAIAMAATWNPELAREEGAVTARETRASGIPWIFYPVIDVGRQPLWSRFFETYGEDPYLVAKMGVANVEGQQGSDLSAPDKAVACLKHYAGYSLPLTGKDKTPAILTERVLHEYVLPSFAAAIKAGAQTVMVNTAQIDGIPSHANHHLLTEILRGELGFKGFTVSDWEDIKNLFERDHVAKSLDEAVKVAVMAGVDMSMVPFDTSFADSVVRLVKSGRIPQKRVDEAVGRILRVKMLLGLFENPYPPKSVSDFASASAKSANLNAAQEAITLLKNEKNSLPLAKNAKVLITGPGADSRSMLNGGWTLTWQGDQEALYPKTQKTILAAIQEKIGAENVTYVAGSGIDKPIDIEKAVKAAKKADAVVLCLGEKPSTEIPGNIDDLNLDLAQIQLAEALLGTGKPVILVLTEARPRIIHRIVSAAAIVMAYLPGMEGGPAIADVLYGDINPSGKLPFSYPRAANALVMYDHSYSEEKGGNEYSPEFPFAHGLSYTKFIYDGLKLEKSAISPGESLRVTVTVKNSGERSGKIVVPLFLSQLYRSIAPQVKRLKGFQKISLSKGESRTIEFILKPEDFSFFGLTGKFVTEPGEFQVEVGDLRKGFTLK